MERVWRHWLAFTAVACVLALSAAWAAEEKDDPFFPSLVNTPKGKLVRIKDFKPAVTCQECHGDIYKQWKGSMHSLAYKDPVFQALWKLGDKETNGQTNKLCLGCHSTAGVVSGTVVDTKGKNVPEVVEDGVQCHVCHSVKSTRVDRSPTGEPQNASFLITPGRAHFGPFKDGWSWRHKTEYSELHTKSEFCAGCHQLFHPANNMPIARTYSEWKDSIYAEKDIQCQDCHMQPVDKAIEVARTFRKPKNPGWAAKKGPKRPHLFVAEYLDERLYRT